MNNPSDSAVVLAAKVGAQIIICGGEIDRAEDAAERICRAYGFSDISVFALTSFILVSAASENVYFTHSVRIKRTSVSLKRLENINRFSRKICQFAPDAERAVIEFGKLCEQSQKINVRKLIGFALTASDFTLFYGGDAKDFFCALFIGCTMYFLDMLFSRSSCSHALRTALLSFFSGFSALCLNAALIASNSDKIMIGCTILLVPGLVITNSVRNFLSENTVSAILHLSQAIITSLAIALGLAFSFIIWSAL